MDKWWIFIKQILVSIDQFLCLIIFGFVYLIGKGPLPDPDETISSVVGKNALKGKKWALIAEKIINRLFECLGEENHCYNAIEWDEKNISE